MLTLVLGCARSGKSRFAQSLCAGAQRVTYIATARADDDEMRRRIVRHQQSRPADWRTIEEPLAIADAIKSRAQESDFILLDCLTLWLSNLCWEHRDSPEEVLEAAVSKEAARLVTVAPASHLVIVSNEVGGGLVPESAVGRRFRDLQGWLNQDVAGASDAVYYVVAGIPVQVKRAEAKL